AGTWLGQALGGRAAYWLVVGVAVMTALMLRAVPPRPGDPHATVRRELTALRQPQVIVAVLTGMVGFGGVFAMYSYVAPLIRQETGLPAGSVPWFLFAFGVGSVLGTWLAGRLADWDVEDRKSTRLNPVTCKSRMPTSA